MLSDAHRAQLEASAVSLALQAERGYCTIRGLDDWLALGCPSISKTFAHIGLAFPVYRLGAEQAYTWVLRPDNPRRINGKALKYEWPKGRSPCFGVLSRYRHALGDPRVPIWFTEGAKKADALATAYGDAIVPININGVWGFRGTNPAGGKIVLPDIDEIAWNGRDVVLAFDSDVARNGKVAAALRRLAALLLARGVGSVQMLLLPQIDDEKVGVDDFLHIGQTIQQLEAHLTPLAQGLAQTRTKLTTHPETGRDLFLPHNWTPDVPKQLAAPQITRAGSTNNIPVTPDEWRADLARRNTVFGRPNGYWCYVQLGTYRIGGWEKGDEWADIALDGFWIAKYPITVAQFAPFVREGYKESARKYWTTNGWDWVIKEKRKQPYYWGDKNFDAPQQTSSA